MKNLIYIIPLVLLTCQPVESPPIEDLCVYEGENAFNGATDSPGDVAYEFDLSNSTYVGENQQFNQLSGIEFDNQNAAWFSFRYVLGRDAFHLSPVWVDNGDTVVLDSFMTLTYVVHETDTITTHVEPLPASQSVAFRLTDNGVLIEHIQPLNAASTTYTEIHPYFGPAVAPDTICLTRKLIEQ